MKKITICILLAFTTFYVTACGNKGKTDTKINTDNKVEKAINDQIEKAVNEEVKAEVDKEVAKLEEGGKTASSDQIVTQNGELIGATSEFEALLEKAKNNKGEGGVDYDLTLMSKDMVYATVYLFMNQPDEFEGKTIKMKGSYLPVYYKETNAYYSYCFISDAAGCCQQGIEFALKEGAKYPEDYPKEGEEIEVVGTFEIYIEKGKIYCHLKDSVVKVLK